MGVFVCIRALPPPRLAPSAARPTHRRAGIPGPSRAGFIHAGHSSAAQPHCPPAQPAEAWHPSAIRHMANEEYDAPVDISTENTTMLTIILAIAGIYRTKRVSSW